MKLVRTRPRLQHARRAALTVELALTLPIFFLILFGGLEMVRVNMLRNGLENAAFEGARRGSLPGSTSAAATAATQTILTALDVRNATITISPTTITNATSEVTVTVSAPIASNLWISGFFTTGTTMTKACTLIRERTKRPMP